MGFKRIRVVAVLLLIFGVILFEFASVYADDSYAKPLGELTGVDFGNFYKKDLSPYVIGHSEYVSLPSELVYVQKKSDTQFSLQYYGFINAWARPDNTGFYFKGQNTLSTFLYTYNDGLWSCQVDIPYSISYANIQNTFKSSDMAKGLYCEENILYEYPPFYCLAVPNPEPSPEPTPEPSEDPAPSPTPIPTQKPDYGSIWHYDDELTYYENMTLIELTKSNIGLKEQNVMFVEQNKLLTEQVNYLNSIYIFIAFAIIVSGSGFVIYLAFKPLLLILR